MKNVKKGKRKKSDKPQFGLISKILLTINILVVVLYLTACYIGYVDPNSASYLALMPMAYPLFFVATIPTLLFWVVKHRRLMLITVCSWLATIPQICTFMPIHFNDIEQAQSEKGSYTLTTYNTLGFAGDKETKNAIIDEILEKNADFVCIQEGTTIDDLRYWNTDPDRIARLCARYQHPYGIDRANRRRQAAIYGPDTNGKKRDTERRTLASAQQTAKSRPTTSRASAPYQEHCRQPSHGVAPYAAIHLRRLQRPALHLFLPHGKRKLQRCLYRCRGRLRSHL